LLKRKALFILDASAWAQRCVWH